MNRTRALQSRLALACCYFHRSTSPICPLWGWGWGWGFCFGFGVLPSHFFPRIRHKCGVLQKYFCIKRKRKAERPTVQRIAPARFRRPSFSLSFPSYHFLFGFGFCGFPFRVKSSTPPPARGAFVDLSYGIIHRKIPTFVYFHHMRCCCSISRDDLIFLFEFTFIIAWSAVGLE